MSHCECSYSLHLSVSISGISKVTVQVPVGKEWELCLKFRVQAAEVWSGFSSFFVCLQASLSQWVAVFHFLIFPFLRDFTCMRTAEQAEFNYSPARHPLPPVLLAVD